MDPPRYFFKPLVNYSEWWPDLKVEHLFNAQQDQWNQGVIDHIFHSIDAQRILSITCPSQNMEDHKIWVPAKNENFSVKVAYHFGFQLSDHKSCPSSSAAVIPRQFWSFLWGSPLAPKPNFGYGEPLGTNYLLMINLLRGG